MTENQQQPSRHNASHPQGGEGAPRHKRRGMGDVLKFLVPAVVSVGLCWVMFRDIDFADMMTVIREQCDFRWIGLNLLLGLIPCFLRGYRWGIQLNAVGVHAPGRVLVCSIFGTYAVNLVFPRLGEVWRSGYVSYNENTHFSTVFGAMIADRLADTLTVLLLTLCTCIVAHGPILEFIHTYPAAYRMLLAIATSPWVWGGWILLSGGAWWLLSRRKAPWVLRLKSFLTGLWQGFAGIIHMHGKLRWGLYTLGIWGCYFLQLYVAFHAFPMTEQLLATHGAVVVLVCFVLTSISMGIPSNGGIGPYQTTMLFGLGLFFPLASAYTAPEAAAGVLEGMSREEFRTIGAAFGNVIIAAQTLMFALCGLVTFLLIAIGKKRRLREGSKG